MVFSKNQLSLPTTYSKNRARSLNQEVKMSQTHLVPNQFLTLMAKYFPRKNIFCSMNKDKIRGKFLKLYIVLLRAKLTCAIKFSLTGLVEVASKVAV